MKALIACTVIVIICLTASISILGFNLGPFIGAVMSIVVICIYSWRNALMIDRSIRYMDESN